MKTMIIKDLKLASVEVIGRHEGWRSKKYKDTKGIWTIGYGFNMESNTFPKEDVERWSKSGITKEEGDKILLGHIDSVYKSVSRKHAFFKDLDDVRKLVILDMVYNMGERWLTTWTNTMTAIKSKNYKGAANLIIKTLYARQVGKRAFENAYALAYGEYPQATVTLAELRVALAKK